MLLFSEAVIEMQQENREQDPGAEPLSHMPPPPAAAARQFLQQSLTWKAGDENRVFVMCISESLHEKQNGFNLIKKFDKNIDLHTFCFYLSYISSHKLHCKVKILQFVFSCLNLSCVSLSKVLPA